MLMKWYFSNLFYYWFARFYNFAMKSYVLFMLLSFVFIFLNIFMSICFCFIDLEGSSLVYLFEYFNLISEPVLKEGMCYFLSMVNNDMLALSGSDMGSIKSIASNESSFYSLSPQVSSLGSYSDMCALDDFRNYVNKDVVSVSSSMVVEMGSSELNYHKECKTMLEVAEEHSSMMLKKMGFACCYTVIVITIFGIIVATVWVKTHSS